MAKLIRINETKALKIEPVKIGEHYGISIRQMYATKKDPKLKPARQGVVIPIEVAERIARIVKNYAVDENTDFVELSRNND